MFPDLDEVKKRREKLNLTQEELAKRCGVSQSTIAKIESENINPSYETMRKIFMTLEKIKAKRKQDITAEDIMTKEVRRVEKGQKVKEAVELMKEHGYSQLPVYSKGTCIGSISEEIILNLVTEEKNLDTIYESNVGTYMSETFPRINKNTPLSVITVLLKHDPAVLVTQRGETVGIITKADLLKIGYPSEEGASSPS
ncbi:MAG: CBS domain-containing protein [Candidatus Korarchaeota archaeon]|nr:CBS domain-containing protein [Candidatus Korarchaeota archaeon]NIU83851.1 CBS domain-containing protein [Candidatus Thorarchaeota archaeon]NIW13993.1 CBS domain-containing protein [Candidatus Thorarchaeota archaeon]NIW53609.1 CBS domain-containing protein [Candidatus Korarchaeota archaeon]